MVSTSDIFALVAEVPLAFVPVLTWTVVTWTALGVYQLFDFKLMLVDYVVAPLALMYIIYFAWKKDSWGGLAGAVMGVAIALAGKTIGITSVAAIVVEEMAAVILWAISMVSKYMFGMFILGLIAGVFTPLTVLISGIMALIVYAYNTYVDYLLEMGYRAVHRATQDLQAGVHVLAGVGAAAVLGVIDVAMATAMFLLIGAYTLGVIISGSLVGWLTGTLSLVFHAIALGLSVAASRSKYHYVIASYVVSIVVTHLVGIASAGIGWLTAVALLFSRRYGHAGYFMLAASAAAAAVVLRIDEIWHMIISSLFGR